MMGFKVITKHQDIMFSCIMGLNGNIYKEGMFIWSKDNWGPLAIFDNEKDARTFCGTLDQIWECEYRSSKRENLYYLNEDGDLVTLPNHALPYGTVLAEAVKLTRRIM